MLKNQIFFDEESRKWLIAILDKDVADMSSCNNCIFDKEERCDGRLCNVEGKNLHYRLATPDELSKYVANLMPIVIIQEQPIYELNAPVRSRKLQLAKKDETGE